MNTGFFILEICNSVLYFVFTQLLLRENNGEKQ